MKKLLALLIAGLFVMGSVAGCGAKEEKKPPKPTEEKTVKDLKKAGEDLKKAGEKVGEDVKKAVEEK